MHHYIQLCDYIFHFLLFEVVIPETKEYTWNNFKSPFQNQWFHVSDYLRTLVKFDNQIKWMCYLRDNNYYEIYCKSFQSYFDKKPYMRYFFNSPPEEFDHHFRIFWESKLINNFVGWKHSFEEDLTKTEGASMVTKKDRQD